MTIAPIPILKKYTANPASRNHGGSRYDLYEYNERDAIGQLIPAWIEQVDRNPELFNLSTLTTPARTALEYYRWLTTQNQKSSDSRVRFSIIGQDGNATGIAISQPSKINIPFITFILRSPDGLTKVALEKRHIDSKQPGIMPIFTDYLTSGLAEKAFLADRPCEGARNILRGLAKEEGVGEQPFSITCTGGEMKRVAMPYEVYKYSLTFQLENGAIRK